MEEQRSRIEGHQASHTPTGLKRKKWGERLREESLDGFATSNYIITCP
jgi:hypothetical protein